jgi:FkbM family methyltransferase
MLISVSELALNYGCHPGIVWHLGGHNAEELDDYLNNGAEEIHWFEANPEQAEILQNKLKDIPDQHVISRAAWDTDGDILTFKITNNTMSSSVYDLGIHSEKYPDIVLSKTLDVETITLNTYCLNREVPNLLNLDIQGAEFNALKGASSFLDKVSYIYTEVSFVALYQNAPLADEIDRYLYGFGFKRVVTRKVPKDGWADVLYVNKRLKKLPFNRTIHRQFNNLRYAIKCKTYEFRASIHDFRERL